MKGFYTFLIFFFGFTVTIQSQPTNNLLGDVSMAAPTVGNLLQFSDIPISYATGVPSIAIPLYTVQEGALSLPISLSYHAAGVKPATNASWTGDWTLMAGGSITRTVMNAPDEGSAGYYYIGETLAPSNVENSDTASMMANGTLDSEPDIFAYNFAGYSGKFFFDADSKNTGKVRFVTQNNLQLEWNLLGNQWEYFIMTTPDGTRYFFGKIPGTATTAYEETGRTFNIPQRSTWHLLRVQSYDGNYQIDLAYEDDWNAYKTPATCKVVYSECATSEQIGNPGVFGSSFDNYTYYQQNTCTSTSNDGIYHPWIKMANKGKRLCSITTPNCMISFVADTIREDVEAHPDAINRSTRLERIEVTSGAYQFDYHFSYDYWYDDSSIPGYSWSAAIQANQPEFYRLRLNSIQKVAADNSVSEAPYLFTYETKENEPDYYPFRLTKAVDHWGYFNAAEGNNGRNYNIPKTTVYGNQSTLTYDDQIDRESDTLAMKYGVLKQIQYPTGGTASFLFEANNVSIVQNGTPTSIETKPTCTAPIDASCCNMASDTISHTFTSLEELENTVFELCVESTKPPSGGTGENCTDSSIDDVITVRVDIIETPSNRIIGGWGFGIEESFANSSFCPIVSDGAPIEAILYPGEVMDTAILYKFAVVSDNGFGVLELRTLGDLEYADRAVGGLRIKQVRRSDGIASTDNDIVKTYHYRAEDESRSSGVLVDDPTYGAYLQVASQASSPSFNQSLTGSAVIFAAESIVPLSSFEGYHIRYRRVIEDHNGNGESLYMNHIEAYTPPPSAFYPIPPEQVRVRDGKTEESYHYRENETLVNAQNIIPDFAYTQVPGFVAKVIPTEVECVNFGAGDPSPIIGYTPYTNRVGYYLNGTVTTTLDGVETVTEYEYDHASGLRHLFPTATIFTNSDDTEYKTTHLYAHDFAAIPIYQEMVDSNIIAAPIRTTIEVTKSGSNYLIAGSDTEYSYFDAGGDPTATQSGNDDPYPYRLNSYKRTFDESGNPTAGYWELEATIESRYADSEIGKAGYRKIIQTEDWNLKDTLDWHHGILKSRAFGDHKSSRTFHPNTRMIASQTDIDGQPVFVNYDQLMRVDTILARPKNGNFNPNPRLTDSFNVVTTAEYVYPQLMGELAYKRVRTDFAADLTGNSDYRFMESVAYTDGLGRLIQTVQRQHSPDSLDVVVAQEWDKQGRIERVYEPFKSSSNTGDYVPNIPFPANQAYTETRYFNSPLNRMRGVTPPQWHETLMDYESNGANEVQNLEAGGFYPENSLMKQIATDPDQKRVITFMDKKGRPIMTRRDSLGSTHFTETYQLYDDKDRPTKVIPPGATLLTDNLLFSYLYDEDDNLIRQKIPDKDTVYMQYDERELLTAMQDGIMRDSNRWVVSLIDDYGRITQTGFYQNASNPDQNNPTINNGLLTETFYDGGTDIDPTAQPIYYGRIRKSRSSILNGYLPTSDFIETNFTYDDFGRTTNIWGNNHINLGFPLAEQQFFFYDFADNMTIRQHRQTAYNNTVTETQERSTLDHKGRMKDAFHQINLGAEEHCSQMEYTVRDLVKTRKLGGLSGNNFLQVVDYDYNPQRWLKQINQPLPQDALPPDGRLAQPDDLFYMRLNYDNGDGDVNAPDQRSGNISNIKWQTLGENRLSIYGYQYDFLDRLTLSTYATQTGSTKNVTNDFGTCYAYDLRGNLLKLDRNGKYGDTIQTIDQLSYAYFLNSNQIQSITDTAVCPVQLIIAENIEQSEDYRASECITFKAGFSFSGAEDGTMTAKIECTAGTKYTEGFVQRSTDDYQYDANGNQTTDPNKTINTKYNHLNLPYEVTWSNGNKIEWIYTADGSKLRKLAIKSSSSDTLSKKDYVGELEYQSDTLEAIYTGYGRAISDSSSFTYQYTIADYLGNTRVVFQDDGTGTAELVSQSAYYPFGLTIDELNESYDTPLYEYQFNGKEIQSDFGLGWNDFGNRQQDPTTARFTTIDRFADKYAPMSPFGYAANNPIKFIDVNGDSLRLTFVGNSQAAAITGLAGIINNTLEGQFNALLTNFAYDEKSGAISANLEIPATENGGDVSKMSLHGQEFYRYLSGIIDQKETTSIKVDYANSTVNTGLFTAETIDVADMLQFNENVSQLGGTQAGKFIHEVVEQYHKQIAKLPYSYGLDGDTGAHGVATQAEIDVNLSGREDITPDGLTQRYYGYMKPYIGKYVDTEIKINRRIISVTNSKPQNRN